MKVYITKSVARGIVETEAVIINGGRTVCVPGLGTYFGEGIEWHRTREAAEARYTELCNRRRLRLRAELAKLENRPCP